MIFRAILLVLLTIGAIAPLFWPQAEKTTCDPNSALEWLRCEASP